MTTIHHPQPHIDAPPTGNVFFRQFHCSEESTYYSDAVKRLVFDKVQKNNIPPIIVEFGSGNGSPILSAILNSDFFGVVHGYEINPEATETATANILQTGLGRQYIIHNKSFFDDKSIQYSDFLVANPPYLPSTKKKDLILPDLCGGPNGNEVSKRLLASGFSNVMLLVSGYSDPAGLIRCASELGYSVADFQVTQMPFGIYSRQDIVQERIHELKKAGKAFFTPNCYLVSSVLFTKTRENDLDLSPELLTCLTSLGNRNANRRKFKAHENIYR